MKALDPSSLSEEIQSAIRSGDRRRVSVLRLLSTAIRNEEVDKKRALTDQEAIAVVRREVRKREEAAETYERGGRPERARDERDEAALLLDWLPEEIPPDELDRLIEEAIGESGATGPRDIGKVMALVMPRVAGRADGATVSEKVKSLLVPRGE